MTPERTPARLACLALLDIEPRLRREAVKRDIGLNTQQTERRVASTEGNLESNELWN